MRERDCRTPRTAELDERINRLLERQKAVNSVFRGLVNDLLAQYHQEDKVLIYQGPTEVSGEGIKPSHVFKVKPIDKLCHL